MQVQLTPPLLVRTIRGTALDLMPVVMTRLPSWKPAVYTQFLKPGARRLELSEADLKKVQAYMREYQTEAVTEDGSHAFTVAGDGLIECQPDIVETLFDKEEGKHANMDD